MTRSDSSAPPRARQNLAALRLPSPRGVALELVRRSEDDDLSIAEVSRLAQADPALAGRLLKAANSAALGVRRATASLQEAVLRLGLACVRQLAVSFSLVDQHRGGACRGFDYGAFWSKSLVRALAAQTLAGRLRLAPPDEAFCCGLLGQIGRLGLACAYPEAYSEVLAVAGAEDDERLREEERSRLALDHAQLTALLLEDWHFPRPLLAAVEGHFALGPARSDLDSRLERLARVLEIARHLAQAAMAAPAEKRMHSSAALLAAARLGIDADGIQTLAENVQSQVAEWAGLLGVAAPSGPLLSLAAPEAAAGASDAPSSGRLDALLLGDDARLTALKQQLEAAGFAVALAGRSNGVDGILARFAPRLVVLDAAAQGSDAAAYAPLLRGLAQRLRQHEEQGAQDLETIRRFAAELAVNSRTLQQLSLVDPATGLFNRRYAFERLEQECAAARRRGTSLACVALQLEGLRSVSARLGAEVAAAALGHLAGVLRASARLQDAVCRVGDDEFLIICPDTSLAEARVLEQRLRAAMAAQPYTRAPGEPVSLEVGVGAAGAEGAGAVPIELLRSARGALRPPRPAGETRA